METEVDVFIENWSPEHLSLALTKLVLLVEYCSNRKLSEAFNYAANCVRCDHSITILNIIVQHVSRIIPVQDDPSEQVHAEANGVQGKHLIVELTDEPVLFYVSSDPDQSDSQESK